MLKQLILLVILLQIITCQEDWDRISSTFGQFRNIPLSERDARDEGWMSNTTNCNGYYKGFRYIKNDDPSQMPLYYNDDIVGMQYAVSSTPDAPNRNAPNQIWHKDVELFMWTLTVYYRDLNTICSNGSTVFDNPIGDRLALLVGNNTLELPLTEDQVQRNRLWIPSPCFVGMGKHYWFNISKGMDCDYFYPIGLMYGGDGSLVTYLVNIGYEESSPRWEHPPVDIVSGTFIDEKHFPKCLYDRSGLTVMHNTFINPLWNNCLFTDEEKLPKHF